MAEGAVDFVRRQLELMRRQCEAIGRGDLEAARAVSDQLNHTLPGLARIVSEIRDKAAGGCEDGDGVLGMVREMKSLQEGAAESLAASRDQLAHLLHDTRRGRQLLSRYHSGRRTEHRLFDICG